MKETQIYDFNTILPRKNCGSMKWDELNAYHCPEDIIPFSVADMELCTMPEIVEGLKKFLDQSILGYANPTPAYKDSVVQWMKRHHNWDASPEWIIDTPGVIHAFFSAVHAFTKPGDGILLMTPVYYPMYFAAQRNGRKLVSSSLINTNGVYTIDFEDFEAKAKLPDTRLCILCSPHNPSGRVWTVEELQRIHEICLANNVLVCSDEIHNDLIMPGHKHTVFASLSEEAAQNSIICTSPSKTFNLAGLQTSNIFIPNKTYRERFYAELLRHDGNPKCNILGLEGCRLAYTCGDAWLSQLLTLLETNRQLVTGFLHTHYPEVHVSPLEGTYLLWMDFRPLGIEPHALSRILKEEAYLFFDDGFIFGDLGAGFERWNLACPTHFISEGLKRLDNTLQQYLHS